ncbi:MAG: hypothetical protein U5L04_07500 [Trueperaceae bacterium]|nr:hypothetical protein [Trueperaceae bacterium]
MSCPNHDGSSDDCVRGLEPNLHTAVSAKAPSCGNPERTEARD